MFACFRENSEKRQACRKERFISLAIIFALPLPLAALSAATRKETADFAFFRNKKAFLYELRCLFSVQRVFDANAFNVAEQPFICAIEVAGIKIAVALNNELMSAVTAK